MKMKRIVVKGLGYYHVFNRTAYARYVLNDEEREMFLKMMRKQALFCGVDVLSFCILSNHYHLLVRIKEEREVSDGELMERYRQLYQDDPEPRAAMRPSDLEAALIINDARADQLRRQLKLRMNSLSVFMKELQQRFGIWYNATHGNKGTLWSERFRSVLVENDPRILSIVAAYIELNPVRAGIVGSPELYRWCSLSAALAGDLDAQQGICAITGYIDDYKSALAVYIRQIFGVGSHPKKLERLILSTHENAVPGKGIALKNDPLMRRIRAFTRGVILGSAAYLKSVQEQHRDRLGWKKKRSSIQEIEDANLTGVCAMRNAQ